MDDAQRDLIRNTFDAVADGYDNPALRFFPHSAAHMAERLGLHGDEHVLDVACGTGHATLALARRLPRGHVTATDFAPAMLAQARAKTAAAGLANVDFVEGDMQAMPWQGSFDAAVCAFGIFFAADMDAQLARVARAVKPGGRVMISNFTRDYMEPLRALMVDRLRRFGVVPPPPTWLRTGSAEGCRELFERAGLGAITVEQHDFGYPLTDATQWWDVIWNAGFRRLIAGVPAAQQASFRAEHLAEIAALATTEGIRMPVPVLLTSGTVAG
jgi:ubiquinone/menaquinone biosynthesis C-methylase UbiE